MTLCYEIWVDSVLVSSYWDVQTAWKVGEAIVKTHPGSDVTILVANGMQQDCITGVRSKRTDVIG